MIAAGAVRDMSKTCDDTGQLGKRGCLDDHSIAWCVI